MGVETVTQCVSCSFHRGDQASTIGLGKASTGRCFRDNVCMDGVCMKGLNTAIRTFPAHLSSNLYY